MAKQSSYLGSSGHIPVVFIYQSTVVLQAETETQTNFYSTALLPIIAGYQLSPDRIQIGTTSPKVASQVSQIRYNYFKNE